MAWHIYLENISYALEMNVLLLLLDVIFCICLLDTFRLYCYYWLTKSCLTLQSHGLQLARFPCPSLSPKVCSNSCPLSRWCDAIQPVHPLTTPSLALKLSQHQGLFSSKASILLCSAFFIVQFSYHSVA